MIRRLTGGYYGTRNADFFPKLFIQRACAGSLFSDITAGTGQFPYRLATQYGKPVVLFERCPYVGYLLRAIFEGEVHNSHSARIGSLPKGSAEGFLTHLRSDLVGTIFSPEVARRIDFLANYALHEKDSALSHAIGRGMGAVVYRSLNWCRTLITGEKSTSFSVTNLDTTIIRILKELLAYRHGIADEVIAKSVVLIGDSCKLVGKVGANEGLRDGVIYADPAWPWKQSGESNENPYRFAYEHLSSIIVQKQLTLSELWTRKDGARIKQEMIGWARDSFRFGARQFIACTQDTNYPEPEEVRSWFLDEGFKIPHTMTLHDYSASGGKPYLNYWFFVEV